MRPVRPRQVVADVLAAVVCMLAVVGCGSSGPPGESGRSTRVPFGGPLFLAGPTGDRTAWGGAAGAVVQCTGRVDSAGTSSAPYREGSVGRTLRGALRDASTVVSVAVPLLHLERRDADRALYTSVYGGRVVQAIVGGLRPRGLARGGVESPRRRGVEPGDAVDTGWSRDGERLWLSAVRALAYVGTQASSVEFWPELTTPTGCD